MAQASLTVAACAALLWAGTALWVAPASALDKCTAKIRPTDGVILVGAKSVTGTVLWGISAGTATNAFGNAGTCVAGSPLAAKNCTLGTGAVAITPPPLCTVYLADDAGTCSAFIKKCTPSKKPRFIDNGDGTVSDTTTGLMWEKKTTDGSLHDVTKTFTWSTGTNNFDGTAKTPFLDKLNDVAGGGAHCFAGYCDWRLPTSGGNPAGSSREPAELETILDLTQGNCSGGTGACVVPALNPTQSLHYWSATTFAGYPGFAWNVNFSNGNVNYDGKTLNGYVRAVRSGL
jgi:hypothetical protein